MQKLAGLVLVIFSFSGLTATLEVLENAKYAGFYGMRIQHDGTTPGYVQDDSPIAETRYRARFYLRLNNINIADGQSFELFSGFNSSNTKQFILNIIRSGSTLYLQSSVLVNTGSYQETPLLQSPVINDGWHAIEIDWKADSIEGHLNIWFDGSLTTGISDLENDQSVIDYIRLGAPSGVPAGSSGSHDFDLFESRRINYIGLECYTQQEILSAIHSWRPTYSIADLVQWLNAECP